MSEAEVMQGFFSSSQVVISLFSAFFAMVSAYIAGLYFFLNRAPLALRLLAFFLLSIGIAFLGGAVAIQQRVQDGLFTAWAKLPSPMMSVELLLNPFPFSLPQGWSLYYIGATLGWLTGFCVYVALGYMTFVYRWKVTWSNR
jgi:hypothetical protein